jgi:hypothetical protein
MDIERKAKAKDRNDRNKILRNMARYTLRVQIRNTVIRKELNTEWPKVS